MAKVFIMDAMYFKCIRQNDKKYMTNMETISDIVIYNYLVITTKRGNI